MTKEQYYDMCEMLREEPIPENIPVEYDDFPNEVQEAIIVYNAMQDNWDSMNGVYLGKVMTGIVDLFNLMGVEDQKSCYLVIKIVDSVRSKILNRKQEKPAS